MGKWLAGIAATVIGAVAIWFLTREGGLLNPDRNCVIRGSVHAVAEPHDPLANVAILFVPSAGERSELARTAPTGDFSGACPPRNAFPISFEISRTDWPGTVKTDVAMTADGTETEVNLYVDEDFANLPVEDRTRVAEIAGYSAVYLLADEPDSAKVPLTAPGAIMLESIDGIDNRVRIPDALLPSGSPQRNEPVLAP